MVIELIQQTQLIEANLFFSPLFIVGFLMFSFFFYKYIKRENTLSSFFLTFIGWILIYLGSFKTEINTLPAINNSVVLTLKTKVYSPLYFKVAIFLASIFALVSIYVIVMWVVDIITDTKKANWNKGKWKSFEKKK